MPNFNQVILVGHLTRDPELKYLQNGTALCTFGLACNRKFTAGKEQRDEVLFVDITAWGKQAELIAETMKKGQAIFITGRLKLEQWKDKDGAAHSKIGVTCEGFQFLERRETPAAAPKQGALPVDDQAPGQGSTVPF